MEIRIVPHKHPFENSTWWLIQLKRVILRIGSLKVWHWRTVGDYEFIDDAISIRNKIIELGHGESVCKSDLDFDLSNQLEVFKRANKKLFDEKQHLLASLKPILDIVMDKHTSDLSMEMAIKESRRIYNSWNED